MGRVYREGQWDEQNVIRTLLEGVKLPQMLRVRQGFDDHSIEDLTGAVHEAMGQRKIRDRVAPGMRIAVTAGSRGLDRYPELMRAIVAELKAMGAAPFLIPAMGSHGGGTAQGQRLMLESLGITEEKVGAPICATMEVVQIGTNVDGYPVYIDRYAAQADGIVVVNRIKPHTNFRGDYESGLMKMLTIGLGKNIGAATCHSLPMDDMPHNVLAFGSAVLEHANVLFGVATLENGLDRVKKVVALPAEEIAEREPELQAQAKRSMPRILFDPLDVLVIDRIGKNFSGPGMDPNITGISGNPNLRLKPDVQRRVVLDLSEETHGNGLGMGLADISTRRVFEKTDFDAIYANNITSRSLAGGKMPLIMRNDRTALKAAVYTCTGIGEKGPRIVRIPNSLQIGVIEISTALWEEARKNPAVEYLEGPYFWEFDEKEDLIDMA